MPYKNNNKICMKESSFQDMQFITSEQIFSICPSFHDICSTLARIWKWLFGFRSLKSKLLSLPSKGINVKSFLYKYILMNAVGGKYAETHTFRCVTYNV